MFITYLSYLSLFALLRGFSLLLIMAVLNLYDLYLIKEKLLAFNETYSCSGASTAKAYSLFSQGGSERQLRVSQSRFLVLTWWRHLERKSPNVTTWTPKFPIVGGKPP